MEQRPLRLGDILDDYCPRERRVTNHAVVAMIEEDVKQTRCTTCDTEHVYKGGKAPRRKKSDTTGALYKEVLAGITDQDAPPPAGITAVDAVAGVDADESSAPPPALVQPAAIVAQSAAPAPPIEDDIDPDERQPPFDEGPVHRPLIRAQLARPEGIKIERVAPEFTIRQNPNGRGGFRGGSGSGSGGGSGSGSGDMRARGGGGGGGGRPGGGGGGSNNGHRFGRGPSRPGGGGGGGGRGGGPNQGFGRGPGGGGGQQRSGRPPKRSR